MTIGENIKKLRKERRMTQKELGIALGFNPNNADVRISQYESGKRIPKKNLIINIAHFFEIDALYLTADNMGRYMRLMETLNDLEKLCKCVSSEINDIRYAIQKENY